MGRPRREACVDSQLTASITVRHVPAPSPGVTPASETWRSTDEPPRVCPGQTLDPPLTPRAQNTLVPLSFEVVCSLTLCRFPQRGPIPLVLMALWEALTPGDGGAQIKSAAPQDPPSPQLR